VTAIPLRPLGRTGLRVSALGFGGAPLGDLYAPLPDDAAIGAVRAAQAAGITLFDTAPLYGHGLSEHRIGTALRGVPRESFCLSTKIGRVMHPLEAFDGGSGYVGGFRHRAQFDYSYDGALRALEQSLLRTGLDRVDILLIHDVDIWTHGKDAIERRFREAMDGAYRALERLRAERVVKAIGIGVNEAEMCARFAQAGDFDVMMLAGRYTLLEQGALDNFLPLALEKGIGIMLAGAFNSGILASGARPGAHYNYRPAPPEILARVTKLEAICRAHGVTLAQAAIAFPLGHPAVSSVVLGAVNASEVETNLAALSKSIPAALWQALKAEGLLAAHAPVPA
jgi:D-threo-aldose 1-dehydrogenase